ncbi:MAG: M36 family metallopeptidase [Actinocatenispora sp.]
MAQRLRQASGSKPGSRRRLLPAVAAVGGLVLLAGALPAQADPPGAAHQSRSSGQPDLALGNFDARTDAPGAQGVLQTRVAHAAARPKAGVTTLKRSLGTEGIVDMDPLTGTARQVANTDGFLTGASNAQPATIALDYVRAHPDVFGLSESAAGKLTLRRDYVDVAGTHHLSFVQNVDGVAVFGNGLQANVARNGRLVSVLGSPVAKLPTSLAPAKLSAGAARTQAVRNAGRSATKASATSHSDAAHTTSFADGDTAKQVVFETLGGPRLAWQTLTTPAKGSMYLHVIDAQSGRVLYRQDLAQDAAAKGSAWDNYPGASKGGKRQSRNLTKPGWLPAGSDVLDGANAHVYTDVNDNDKADASEEVHAKGSGNFTFPFTTLNDENPGKGCSDAFPCTWNPNEANSWEANRKQNAVQVFYYLGKYHDHLAAAPIGFTRAAGNFDARDGDAVQAEPDDGANTADGLPNSDHTDNANMSTPPDGTAPRMQMYLWNDPTAQDDGFIPSNGGDEADVVYHEYTHGLSNRLVVGPDGVSTLGNVQAGSMGEAWSDWYAFDYLVNQKYFTDSKKPGDLKIGIYVGHGDTIRSQPLDCQVGASASVCPGTQNAGPGGYTYGDFGKISSRGAEVHADGEIWAETLWDLRSALGSQLSESLVTRAMELSPANPSYLDERNAILQADTVVNGGLAHQKIWKVFAHRGMGYFAGALTGDDTAPVEDFSMPPAPNTPTGSLTGKVTSDSGTPVVGATVAFGGHASGYFGDYAGVTGADGKYTITGIPAGTYPKVFTTGPGYEMSETRTISVSSHTTSANWTLVRDWAATSGGASVVDFNGPDFSDFGCGPGGIYDTTQGQGWGSDAVNGTDGEGIDPRHSTVQLPSAVDISELRIDPSATCGDDQSASTGDYKVETSTDGTTWMVAAEGHFTPDDFGTYVTVSLTAGAENVKFLRFSILGTQVKDYGISCASQPVSGCEFADSTEVLVHGSPS